MNAPARDLTPVLRQFQIPGEFVMAAPYGSGHINETYAAVYDQGGTRIRYVFQRLNTNVFKDPKGLMANIAQVTHHVRKKLADLKVTGLTRRTLTLMPALDGQCYVDDPVHGFWRVYVFVEGAKTYDLLEQDRQAYEAAKAFGQFQNLLADYDGPRLTETIPAFHHTPRRYEALQKAIAEDVCGRAKDVAREIQFALDYEPLAGRLLALQHSGEIPERITHNDTKLNNVMLDDVTGEGVCVIDLDTVMPGLSLYDFGDMVRTACNPVPEDHLDPSQVIARKDMFKALATGYLVGTSGTLKAIEREHLVVAGQLLTYECGIRFLTDYLQGDVYFRTHRNDHNLDRCRTQFALVKSLEDQALEFMKEIRDLI